jgi:chromosome segregation ATPase
MAETTTTTDTPRDSDAGTIPWVPGTVGMVVITVLIGAGYVMLGKAVLPVLDHPVSAEHLAALKTEMATVETTLETKRDNLRRIEFGTTALEEQHEKVAREIAAAANKQAAAEAAETAANNRAAAVNQRLAELEAGTNALTKSREETLRKSAIARAELDNQQNELAMVRQWKSDVAERERRQLTLESEITALEAQLADAAAMKGELALAQEELETARLKAAEYMARQAIAETAIAALNETRSTLAGSTETEQETIRHLKKEAGAERALMSRLSLRNESMRQQLEQISADMAVKKLRMMDMRNKIEKIDELEERIKMLRTNRKTAATELVSEEIRLARFKENYRRTITSYENNIKAQNKEQIAKNRKLAKLDEQIARGQKNIDEHTITIKALKAELNNLQPAP